MKCRVFSENFNVKKKKAVSKGEVFIKKSFFFNNIYTLRGVI